MVCGGSDGDTDAGDPDPTDGGGGDTDGGGGGGESPVISRVEWDSGGGCSAGTRGDVAITVTATDADTPAGDLTFSGSVGGCTGTIDAATTTLSCPHAAPYSGSVTVTDPEANSDTANFSFGPCDVGGADF